LKRFLLAVFLGGCSGSNSASGQSPPSIWAITQGSTTGPLLTNGFDFPVCADPTKCWVSYVQRQQRRNLGPNKQIAMSYEITGNSPSFEYRTNWNNTCGGKPDLVLILQQVDDNLSGDGPYAYYRWFSQPVAQTLALGAFTYTVPLDMAQWVPIFRSSPAADATGWATMLANVGLVGFGFGGGCFAAHGVAVTSGTAHFQLKSYTVQ
jgi:hypothetical protein